MRTYPPAPKMSKDERAMVRQVWDEKYTKSQKCRDALKQAAIRRRKARHEQVDQIKNVPCADCGGRFASCAMDFDHIKGSKSYTISQMVQRGYNMEIILKEVAKCEIVCANCHRVRTYIRSDWTIRYPEDNGRLR